MRTLDPREFLGLEVLGFLADDRTDGKKYRLTEALCLAMPADFAAACAIGRTLALENGRLYISDGWQFDGASGPAIDGTGNLLAALVHDALYELRRIFGKGSGFSYAQADSLYRQICEAQGEGFARRWYHYTALRSFGWVWRLLS